MLVRQLIGAIAFTLTLFVSTAHDEVDASVPRPGDGNIPSLAGSAQPFLCDSALAADCFLMFASEHAAENTTPISLTRQVADRTTRREPVVCAFVLPYHGDRCDRMDGTGQ